MGTVVNPAGRIDATSSDGVDPAAGPDSAEGAVLTREQYGDAYGAGYPRTMRFLLSRGIGLELAEESAQGAWAKGWERRDQLHNPDCLLSWVNTIALNLCRNQLRRREPDELPGDIPVPPPHNSPARLDIRSALAGCTRAERKIIEGHYWAGYTSVELAAGGSCTPGALRIRLMRIRRRLRERLSA